MSVLKYTLQNCKSSTNKKFDVKAFRRRYYCTASKVTEPIDDEKEVHKKLKPLVKLPIRPPFMKNIFQAKFDTDLLAYPEFLGEGRLFGLQKNVEVVDKWITDNVNSTEIDQICNIPAKLLDHVRQLKLLGLKASAKYGGLEFSNTECARVYEYVAHEPALMLTLFSHEILGHQLITKYGDNAQKDRYLKRLIGGKMLSASCFSEAEAGTDALKFETVAAPSDSNWLVSGTKIWVANADVADLFIVFARVTQGFEKEKRNILYNVEGEEISTPDDIGVFLIEKKFPGVTVGPAYDTVGLRGLHVCDVNFKNVLVPETHILGDFKRGYESVKNLLTEDRHLVACCTIPLLRSILADMVSYSIKRKVHGENLYKYGLAQTKLSSMVVNLYAIESMVYFTSGISDMYENQDVELENAICKVFATETAFACFTEGMQLLGGQSFLRNGKYEKYMRDLLMLTQFDHSNDMYRMLIALGGLQHISNKLNDKIYAQRNPMYYPMDLLKNVFSVRFYKQSCENPELILKLKWYLHPSLANISELLEFVILRFDYCIQSALERSGPELVEDQLMLKRIADVAIYIYAMVAVISRASRSYCIGSEHSTEEVVIAETFIRQSTQTCKNIIEGIAYGKFYCTDANVHKLATYTSKRSRYWAEEPLKLNF